jgi:hypothetical protein
MDFKAVLIRVNQTPKQTRGNMIFYQGDSLLYRALILELPWLNNIRGKSCIPDGEYWVDKVENHPKFGDCFLYRHVPGRSEVMIHGGNFTTEIRGCQLPGDMFRDLNKDSELDITNSKITLGALYRLAPQSFKIKIITL